jgi:hypothetical protein
MFYCSQAVTILLLYDEFMIEGDSGYPKLRNPNRKFRILRESSMYPFSPNVMHHDGNVQNIKVPTMINELRHKLPTGFSYLDGQNSLTLTAEQRHGLQEAAISPDHQSFATSDYLDDY